MVSWPGPSLVFLGFCLLRKIDRAASPLCSSQWWCWSWLCWIADDHILIWPVLKFVFKKQKLKIWTKSYEVIQTMINLLAPIFTPTLYWIFWYYKGYTRYYWRWCYKSTSSFSSTTVLVNSRPSAHTNIITYNSFIPFQNVFLLSTYCDYNRTLAWSLRVRKRKFIDKFQN